MSIIAEKIEDGYLKRWSKETVQFIFNNTLIMVLCLCSLIGFGTIIYFTTKHHMFTFIWLLFSIYWFFFMNRLLYESTYKKLDIPIFLKNFNETIKDLKGMISANKFDYFCKFLVIAFLIAIIEYQRFDLPSKMPIKLENGIIITLDMYVKNLLYSSGFIMIFLTIYLSSNLNNYYEKTPFSCLYVLNKFSGFSNEEAVHETITKLATDADTLNYKVHEKLKLMAYFILIPAFLIIQIAPISSIFLFLIIPIFYFQVAKETFLDQGNRKHQKEEAKEENTSSVPDPSGA